MNSEEMVSDRCTRQFIDGIGCCWSMPSGFGCLQCLQLPADSSRNQCLSTTTQPVATMPDVPPPSKKGAGKGHLARIHNDERAAPLLHAGQVSNFLWDSQSEDASVLWEQETKCLDAARSGQLQEQHVATLLRLRFQTFAKLGEIEAMNRFKAMCKQATLAADAAAWVQERRPSATP